MYSTLHALLTFFPMGILTIWLQKLTAHAQRNEYICFYQYLDNVIIADYVNCLKSIRFRFFSTLNLINLALFSLQKG